jgi:hypothetical protein
MFSLTVIDHLRLDTEHAAQNYTVHAREAERLASYGLAARIATATLLGLALAANVASLLYPIRAYQIAAIAAAALALIVYAVHSVYGIEARVTAHRAFAHRLWLLAERFRALVSEIDDGLVDPDVQLHRRDELIRDLHAIYGQGFGVDQRGFEGTRLPPLPKEERAA